ncbi:hypothetical protein GS461_18035 [Rhodococcus hoagii]|nr:hypothetical protein [Prescottella equi]
MTARRRFGAVTVLVAAALLGLAPTAAGAASRTRLPCNRVGAHITRVENITDRWVRVFVYSPAMQSEQEVQVLLPRDTSVPRPSLYLLDGRSASPV